MDTRSILKDLAELITDSQRGYGEAAARIHDPHLKEKLMSIGNGRAPLLEELGNELALLGDPTPDEGTIKGGLHRTWMAIRESLSPADDGQILDEAIRGEEYLLSQVDRTMALEGLPAGLQDLLASHRRHITGDLEALKGWYEKEKSR